MRRGASVGKGHNNCSGPYSDNSGPLSRKRDALVPWWLEWPKG